MKELISFCSLILFFINISFGQDSVSISDFRYSETQALDWKAGLSGDLSTGNYEEGNWGGVNNTLYTTDISSGRYNLNTGFLYFHTKENHDQNVSATFEGSYQTNDRDGQSQNNKLLSKENLKIRIWNYFFGLNWTYLHYFQDEGIHLVGAVNSSYTGYSYVQDVTIQQTNMADSSYHQSMVNYNLTFTGNLGVGYGRMRDGTAVYKAFRVIERLREDGIITKQISREQMLALVDRILTSREYQINCERYDKYFIRDIVKALVDSGIVEKDSITAYSIVRMLETFTIETIQPRFFGWRVYYTFGERQYESGGDQETPTFNYQPYDNQWVYLHTIGAEYGLPISLRTHVTASTKLEIPTRDSKRKFTITANTSISYALGERIEILGGYSFQRTGYDNYEQSSGSLGRFIYHNIQGNFVYFLEDNIHFTTKIGYSWQYNDYFPDYQSYQDHSFFHGLTLTFGMLYNIY